MYAAKINPDYFNWMCSVALPNPQERKNYMNLLNCLDSISYTYLPTVMLDENRSVDGLDLRMHYAYEFGVPEDIMATQFKENWCSVLEVLVAFSIRYDLYNHGGENPSRWIRVIFDNLHLLRYDDSHWNQVSDRAVHEIINTMLYRQYNYDGTNGGPFHLKNPRDDLRKTDIWTQLQWYCVELDDEEELFDQSYYDRYRGY